MKTNAVIDAICTRRSIRVFEKRPLSHEDLETIVTCGQWSPSAKNRQEWTFVIVEDPARIAHLAEVIRNALQRESYDMYQPSAIILVAHAKRAPFAREDDGCAMQTMMLAAHSLGIGSVWINQLQNICDMPAVRAELDSLNVPADSEVHGICALGYAGAETKPKERTSKVVWDSLHV